MGRIGKVQSSSRRRFLRNAAALATGGLLSACALPQERAIPVEQADPTFTIARVPRPQVGNMDSAAPDDEALARFLSLSVVLTGVEQLDASLGRIYLHNLQETTSSGSSGMTVDELLEQIAGGYSVLVTSLSELESRGIFQNEPARKLVDKIIEYWYTGIYETAQGDKVVATHIDALAWKALLFTKPMTVCGSYGFWTEPPEEDID